MSIDKLRFLFIIGQSKTLVLKMNCQANIVATINSIIGHLKSSINQRPSLLRAESLERKKEEREIMPSLLATLLRWRTHSALTNVNR